MSLSPLHSALLAYLDQMSTSELLQPQRKIVLHHGYDIQKIQNLFQDRVPTPSLLLRKQVIHALIRDLSEGTTLFYVENSPQKFTVYGTKKAKEQFQQEQLQKQQLQKDSSITTFEEVDERDLKTIEQEIDKTLDKEKPEQQAPTHKPESTQPELEKRIFIRKELSKTAEEPRLTEQFAQFQDSVKKNIAEAMRKNDEEQRVISRDQQKKKEIEKREIEKQELRLEAVKQDSKKTKRS